MKSAELIRMIQMLTLTSILPVVPSTAPASSAMDTDNNRTCEFDIISSVQLGRLILIHKTNSFRKSPDVCLVSPQDKESAWCAGDVHGVGIADDESSLILHTSRLIVRGQNLVEAGDNVRIVNAAAPESE